jgi:hypothetical protein
MPQEVDTKTPIYYPYEINLAPFGQQTTEERFDLRILGKINNVVKIESQTERML